MIIILLRQITGTDKARKPEMVNFQGISAMEIVSHNNNNYCLKIVGFGFKKKQYYFHYSLR